MKRLTVTGGDAKLSVVVRTGDPTVLFLHGLAGHGGEWDRVIDCLDPGVGIINPDQRAHGATWALGTVGVEGAGFVDDAEHLLERFASGGAVVVGQSMGGIVATLLAHRRPDLVASLVLVEAGMSALTADGLAGVEAWFARWPEVFVDEADATEFFGLDAASTAAWVAGLEVGPHGLARRFDVEAMVEVMMQLAVPSRWREWSELDVPSSVVRAERSFIDDDEMERMRRARPDIEVVRVDDSGHDVHLDQPERVAATVQRRLRQATGKRGIPDR